IINVVTKSGTNEFHGSLFEYFRDESLNSNTPQTTARNLKRPSSQINQFGGSFGGPIVKNRAFFFATYDGQRADVPNIIVLPSLATQPSAIQSLLAPTINTYEVGRKQDVFVIKGDISLNQNNQLSLRYNQQNFTGVNNENNGPRSSEEHSGNSVADTITFSGSLATVLTQKLVNEFRFQFARDKEPGEANSALPEANIVTPDGTFSIGRNNFSPRETTVKRAQFIDNLSYVTGRHNFKVGADLNFDRILNFFPGVFSGAYTFASYTAFLNNQPSRFLQNFPGAGTTGGTTEPNSSEYAYFVQDDWRVTPQFTLNLGLRYDYQALAAPPISNSDPTLLAAGFDTSTQPKNRNNFAPRFGFSFAPSEKSVVRGGYGIFYGRTTAIMLGTAHSQNGINVNGINLVDNLATPINEITAAGAAFPNILLAPPPGTSSNPNLYLFDRNYAQPYVQQGRFGFEYQLLPSLSLSVTYLLYRGVHLSRTRDVNLFPAINTQATDTSGGVFTIERFPGMNLSSTDPLRPLSAFSRISLFESTGNSLYNGLAIELTRRYSKGLQFIASYTLSKAEDDKPDQTSVVVGGGDDFKVAQNTLDPGREFGRSDLDLRHRFVFSPVYELGRFNGGNTFLRALLSDYTLSGILQFQSGFAFSATIPNDLNRDSNLNSDRAPGTIRNEFSTPATYQVDLRLSRSIQFREHKKLSLIVEGFNIFNRTNVAGVLTNRYSGFTVNSASGAITLLPTAVNSPFGAPNLFLSERQLQLAAKFTF
ncbi:MAG: TonB-dependent receptor domain-containing protein, partial [Pyrinomonadaceae bacterium]